MSSIEKMGLYNEPFNTDEFDTTSLNVLHPVNEVTREAEADIIFVPGLGGDYIETWQADDESRTVWPRDLLPLPRYVPGVRVISFKYNTSLNGTTSQARIRDRAKDLLDRLVDEREDDEAASLRPLVFVGHSLGGILIKRALTKMSKERKYQDLWAASRGVMFFATPHFCMDKAKWEDFAHKVLLRRAPSEGVVPTENMLKELKENSDTLDKVSEDFLPLQYDLSFVTFIEGTPMEGMDEVMVNRVYGLIRAGTEFPRRLSGDHIGLCKFRNHDDDLGEFLLVQAGIRDLINDKPRAVHDLTYQEKRALYSLCPTSFHCHSLGQKATKGTCDWIFKTPEMTRWLANESRKERLWINGQAGCGKSFLAQQIIANLQDGKTAAQHGVIHCSLSDSHPSRGDLRALLRATLHQALHLVPDLVPKFLLPTFEAAQGRDDREQEIWTRTVLVTIWVNVMAEVMARQPLTFVIDGLDEIGKECQDTFFDCLGELPEKSQEAFERLPQKAGEATAPKTNLLAISRKTGYIRERLRRLGFQSYDVQPQDTKKDIKKTVRAGLGSLLKARGRNTDTQVENICNRIADDCKGSYLWATLVVEVIRRARMLSENQIMFLLEGYVPGDVDELYSHILFGLTSNPKIAPFVQQVLQWAIFQQEGLRLAEFKLANALAKATEQHPDQVITPEILGSCLDDNIKLRIEFHCGHLVKFQDDGRLSLIHRTLKDHLSTKPNRNPGASPNTSRSNLNTYPFLNPQTAHTTLANLCIAYLTMPCFDKTTSNPHLPIPRPSSTQPLPPKRQSPTTTRFGNNLPKATTAALTNHPSPLTFTNFESRLRHLVKTHAFLRYASLHWHAHLAAAGAAWPGSSKPSSQYNSTDMLARRAWLEDGANPYGQCWAEVWWFFVRGVEQPFPEDGGFPGRVVGKALEDASGVALEVGGGGDAAATATAASAGLVGVGDRGKVVDDGEKGGGGVKEVGHGVKVKKQEQEQGQSKRGSKANGLSRPPVQPRIRRQDAKKENSEPAGMEGRSEKEDREGSHSSGGEDESSGTEEGSDLDAPSKDTTRVKARKIRRKGTKGKEAEKEKVIVENTVYVDRPVEKTVIEKVIVEVEKVKEVEKIKEVIREVERIVEKTPLKEKKIQLSKWGRVKKAGKVLVKEVFT